MQVLSRRRAKAQGLIRYATGDANAPSHQSIHQQSPLIASAIVCAFFTDPFQKLMSRKVNSYKRLSTMVVFQMVPYTEVSCQICLWIHVDVLDAFDLVLPNHYNNLKLPLDFELLITQSEMARLKTYPDDIAQGTKEILTPIFRPFRDSSPAITNLNLDRP